MENLDLEELKKETKLQYFEQLNKYISMAKNYTKWVDRLEVV